MSFPGFPGPTPPPGPGPVPTPDIHNLLSSTHGDTSPASGVIGDVIVALASGIWTRVPAGVELDHLVIMGGIPTWQAQTGSGLGDVTGPSSATDNAIARYDQSTGKVIQNSLVLIDDSGNLSVGGNALVSGDLTVLGSINATSLNVTSLINSGTVINSVAAAATGITVTIGNSYYNPISSGTTTVNLPAVPATGVTYVIKDVDGVAGTTPITVDGNGNTIDGASTQQLATNYGSFTLIFGNVEWNII